MSLNGILSIGQSALAVSQAQLQVTGNNIANAGNEDYTRQVADTSPNQDQKIRPGMFVGTGVNITGINRQIDEALQGRLRASISDSDGAVTTQQWLSRVESIFNELSDDDLSTQYSKFFNSWSDLANKPQDMGLRQIVVQNGENIADATNGLYGQLVGLGSDVGQRVTALASNADKIATQIADLNGQIVRAEGGSQGQANGLRDQRDSLLSQLSQLMDVRTVPQENGVVNVYVGSEPLIVNATNRGVTTSQETVNNEVITHVVVKADNAELKISAGQLGALVDVRERITKTIDDLNTLSGNLIFELNKLHASGQGLQGFDSVTSSNNVTDATVALNDAQSGLKFTPQNGSFVVQVKSKTTGLTTSTLVQVDLDGLNGDDTTLNSLATQLDAITGINAKVASGHLYVNADSDSVEFNFSQDTSGTLAALGINTFFSGHNAMDMAVDANISKDPSLLAAAKNGEPADNQTALAIAGLESQSIDDLNGATLKSTYQGIVNGVASDVDAAKTNADAAQTVNQTLVGQREALSGVSMDEEAINLMKQQRAFQAAAKLVTTVDEMMQTLLGIVR